MEKWTNERSEQFARLLQESVESYLENKDDMSAFDWAKSYLAQKLTDKAEQEVYKIADDIVNAIKMQTDSLQSLRNAEENGQSAEAWFTEETAFDDGSYGKQAMLLSAANEAFSEYDENTPEVEVLDTDFSDDNWNKYSVKELAAKVVENAAESALYTAFDVLSESYSALGVDAVTNADNLIGALRSGASDGIKTAAACAVNIASETGILPDPLTAAASAFISGMSVEKVIQEIEIGDGVSVITNGIKAVQDTATATAAASIKMAKEQIGERAGLIVGGTIGSVFGPGGTIVGERIGAVVGRACGTEVCDLISAGINKLSNIAVNTVSKAVNVFKNLLTI
ncbi:lipase chaperone [Ruminococcus albus]|uniref:Uncharacterized protein n=1 Tax=Ruminococcus albus TaxID=1264 RepID=A0A1H7LGD5_RUMAL|nr:lipase chaperone [Ruminococcus albus]SEK97920.1 hypothetical protein SAMN05216469_10914 [Ruminococcus albus]